MIAEAERKIDSVANKAGGRFAVAFIDLQTGRRIFRNENEKFHAASTIKTAVMVEVFKQAQSGNISLDDSLEVINSFSSYIDGSPYALQPSSDSDDSLYYRIGKREQIGTLLMHMITVSSNLAANLLIQKVGAKNIQGTMDALGVGDIRVLRCVEDTKASTWPERTIRLQPNPWRGWYVKLARKKILGRKASGMMIGILSKQKFADMIPAKLPSSVIVAHKTGSSPGFQHDSGIVYLPGGRKYVLVVLSKELQDQSAGIAAVAEISRIIYDYEMN